MTKKNIRVLMIDDDEEDFFIIRDLLSDISKYNYTIEWVNNYENGIKAIKEKKHDIYLVDYHLGIENGLDLIKEAIETGCTSPLILFTGRDDDEIDEEAMKVGACDYLQKGATTSRQLESSIRYSIEHANHIQEMKMLNANLERRVKDRTMILEEAIAELNKTKEELNEALIKEKELNDLKSRFVTMASHEFRTPLTTIYSSLTLISKYGKLNDEEKQSKHINRIKTSIYTLTDILDDILSISKLEEGKMSVSYEDFEINKFASDIIKEMQALTKTGQVISYTHKREALIYSDKKILKHIFFNLISNAIKFSPEGKTIDVTTEVNKSILDITVKDSGIGISEEDQKHLFERFYRAQNAVNIQGTGLGLNIVDKYIELLNGSIKFESKLEEGTTFIVKIPNIISNE